VVTAVEDGTTVDIVDDDADGDADDTHTDIVLDKGQSYVIYIDDNLDDDGDGELHDGESRPQAPQLGDYFRVKADRPVVVQQFTNSCYEHDFAPATNGAAAGTDFYFYAIENKTGCSNCPQVDTIAYSDRTQVKLIDITDTPTLTSGKTILTDTNGTLVMTTTLDAGEHFISTLEEGRSYHVLANKRVTLQYGPLGYSGGRRDGGAYVPGKAGGSTGRTFYFGIPYQNADERELRIVTYDEGADLSVHGWDSVSSSWDNVITGTHLGPHGHLELIGDELGDNDDGTGYYLFEVQATADVAVFETNWFETGSYGTSDIATYVSSATGSKGRHFEAYLGPPANEEGGQFTHLYVFADEESDVIAYDSDSYGEWVELYNTTTETVDLNDWKLTNEAGRSVVLSGTIAPESYYLLEYHEKATEETSDFVYGNLYPFFKLGNGWDTLTLRDDSDEVQDSFSYTETWHSHGVYAALARITPTLSANDINNWADATTLHANSVDSLGAFQGTPRASNDAYAGDGSGSLEGVVINELLTGRIWRHATISTTVTNTVAGQGGYYDISLDKADWEAINNGNGPEEAPGPIVTDGPEGPFITVESDEFVSVLNTNWNDNWLAYATPSIYPDPSIVYLPSHYQRRPGQVVTFTADVWVEETVLYSPTTTIEIPANMSYTVGSYVSPTQLLDTATVTETQNPDGSWTLTWEHGQPMTTTTSYQFMVSALVPSGTPTGTWLSSVASTTGVDDLDRRYTTQDTANVLVSDEDEAREVDLVINEVMVNPESGPEWIELYNSGTTAIMLTGKVISATGEVTDTLAFSYTIPKVNGTNLVLPTDGYVVIHLAEGTDTQSDLYAGKDSEGLLNDTEGRVFLFGSSEFDANTMIDFVQWDDDGTLSDATGDDLAAIAGQWSDGGYVESPQPGDTLGRDRYSSDTNDDLDWENTGGIHSGAPTHNAVNWTNPGLNLNKIAVPTAVNPAGTVTYIYEVRNTSNRSLNVDLSDAKCSPSFVDGDDDGDGQLDPNEEWTYECSKVLYDDEENVATATGETSTAPIERDSDSDNAFVDVTTERINQPPIARDDEACTHRGVTATVTIDVLDNDSDPEGGALEVIDVTDPHTGTVTYTVDSVTYTPPNDTFTGTVVFTYTVTDDGTGGVGGPRTDTAQVTVYVEENKPPIANDDFAHVVLGSQRVIHVLSNDSDENHHLCDVAHLSVITIGQPLTGTAILNDDNTVTYVPPPMGYTGTVPFTVTFPYTISDNALGVTGPLTDSAWITVVVTYPIGGYTMRLGIPIWPWVMLAPVVGVGILVTVTLKRSRK